MQQPGKFALQRRACHYFLGFKENTAFFLWELQIHFKVKLDLGAIGSKNKHP